MKKRKRDRSRIQGVGGADKESGGFWEGGLIKVDSKAGHGAGKPTSKIIDEVAHIYAFLADATGASWR